MQYHQPFKNLLLSWIRAMLANPSFQAKIEISGDDIVEIDTRPFSPGMLIGEKGSMKQAMQTIMAGTHSPTTFRLQFRNEGQTQSPRLKDQRPNVAVMKPFVEACLEVWRAHGHVVDGRVEASESAVIVFFDLEERLALAQSGALARLVRGIGKANGFPAAIIIDKPAAVA